MVLEAVYEQDFLPCSFGFRPGRSAHQALQYLRISNRQIPHREPSDWNSVTTAAGVGASPPAETVRGRGAIQMAVRSLSPLRSTTSTLSH
jgi:hypothetical protein